MPAFVQAAQGRAGISDVGRAKEKMLHIETPVGTALNGQSDPYTQ
jgi:hypothetical protein